MSEWVREGGREVRGTWRGRGQKGGVEKDRKIPRLSTKPVPNPLIAIAFRFQISKFNLAEPSTSPLHPMLGFLSLSSLAFLSLSSCSSLLLV